jgi:hypothetical protein
MLWGEQTMTLRDEIAAYIEQNAIWSEYDILNEKELADAIIALFRDHLGSDEAMERAANMMGYPPGYTFYSPEPIRAALLAAIEEPHDKG